MIFAADHLCSVLTAVYTSAGRDPKAAVLAQRRLVVAFAFQDPELYLSIDGRSGQATVKVGREDAPPADLTFHLAGADIDPFWRGNLNAVAALSQGRLTIEGSLLLALSLAPAMSGLQARYRELVPEAL